MITRLPRGRVSAAWGRWIRPGDDRGSVGGAAGEAGFTLLELLVGLVVLGFILAGLSQGVRYGVRAGEAQARLSEGRGELDAVDRALRQLIEQMDPGTAHSGAALRGTSGLMAFTSELPAAAAGVTRHADLVLGFEAGRVVLRWTPHLHAQAFGPAPPGQEEELLRGVERLEMAYWNGAWRGEWKAETLPGLVRVRVVFPAGDARRWPDIVAAPQRSRGPE